MLGWGPKSSVCPSKPRESNFFGGISRDFAGISRKRPKSLRKKCLGSIFGPKTLEEVSKKSRTDIFEAFSRLFGLFSRLFQTFGASGLGTPGDSFQIFFLISGTEGPRDSCSSSFGSQGLVRKDNLGIPEPLGPFQQVLNVGA